MDITETWQWPQYTMAIMLFFSLLFVSAKHGDNRIVEHGPRKGLPEQYSAFVAFIRFGMWVFILTCGGFFA